MLGWGGGRGEIRITKKIMVFFLSVIITLHSLHLWRGQLRGSEQEKSLTQTVKELFSCWNEVIFYQLRRKKGRKIVKARVSKTSCALNPLIMYSDYLMGTQEVTSSSTGSSAAKSSSTWNNLAISINVPFFSHASSTQDAIRKTHEKNSHSSY